MRPSVELCFYDFVQTTGTRKSRVAANVTLETPPFRGPVHKIHHVRTVFPGKPEEFSRVQVCRFVAKKSLKSPAQVRAFPGIASIPSCNVPVVP
jgi:hypothetical protein